MIQTVRGPMPAEELGRVMMHEHLVPRGTAAVADGRPPFVPLQTLEVMERELLELRRIGVSTVVDVTPFGKGRDAATLRELSVRTGIHVICATGLYKEPACPAFAHQAGVDEIARFLLREVAEGVDESGVRPGVIKVGTSRGEITATERRVLQAAAVAHRESGLPITTHTTLGTMGRDQVDLLVDQGVRAARVIVGHSDLNREPDYHLEILKTGATVAFDTIGKEHFHYRRYRETGYERHACLLEAHRVRDGDRARLLAELVEMGYAGQIVLSSDILWQEAVANPTTLGAWGYAYLWQRFIPLLIDLGVPEEAVSQMTAENPRKLLEPAR